MKQVWSGQICDIKSNALMRCLHRIHYKTIKALSLPPPPPNPLSHLLSPVSLSHYSDPPALSQAPVNFQQIKTPVLRLAFLNSLISWVAPGKWFLQWAVGLSKQNIHIVNFSFICIYIFEKKTPLFHICEVLLFRAINLPLLYSRISLIIIGVVFSKKHFWGMVTHVHSGSFLHPELLYKKKKK